MIDLQFWTTLVNLSALAIALWLGFYIVTRSPRSLLSWLTTLTFWSLCTLFLYASLITHLSSAGVFIWLWQGVIFVLPLWWHVTSLLLPERARQSAFWNNVNRIGIPLGYIAAGVLVMLGFAFDVLLLQQSTSSPLYTNYRIPGTLYPLFVTFSLLGTIPIAANLLRTRKYVDPAHRAQFMPLLWATLFVFVGGELYIIGTQFFLPIPVMLPDLLLGAGVLFLGYTVARYAAFLEGRVIERDFFYTLLVVGSLTLFYVLIVTAFYVAGAVSFVTLALTVVGTVAANSLFDGVRITLDRLFYRGRFQTLRANLRVLAREAGTGQTLSDHLQGILNALCHALHISRGFVAVRNENDYTVRATFNADALHAPLAFETLDTREMLSLNLPTRRGLRQMNVLIPLCADGEQIGALVLGAPEGKANYQEHDYELLEDLGDQMARIINVTRAQRDNAERINTLVEDYRARERELQLRVQQLIAEREAAAFQDANRVDQEALIPHVEDALRHINDYPYLGEHALAKLRVVERAMQQRGDTAPSSFVDRGKALSQALLAMLDELKPEGAPPKANQVAPREWHLYLILHDSYVLDEPNRQVMSKLYISEGTFNRTRRRALGALAKVLAEYEASAS